MRNRQDRLRIDATLLVLAGILVLAVALPVLAPMRPWLALLGCVLLPGAAVLTLIPVDRFFTWALVAILLSVAIETVTSLVVLWLHVWHPLTLATVLVTISAVLLAVDLARAARSAPSSPPVEPKAPEGTASPDQRLTSWW